MTQTVPRQSDRHLITGQDDLQELPAGNHEVNPEFVPALFQADGQEGFSFFYGQVFIQQCHKFRAEPLSALRFRLF